MRYDWRSSEAEFGPGHSSDRCRLNPSQGAVKPVLGCACTGHLYCSRLSSWVRPQTGLTADLQGFRIRAPQGWPLVQRRAPVLERAGPHPYRRPLRVRREPGAAVARQGLRAAGPAAGSVPGSAGACQLRTVDAPRSGQRSRCAALLHVRWSARAARPARP
jgi:hypothetical protein